MDNMCTPRTRVKTCDVVISELHLCADRFLALKWPSHLEILPLCGLQWVSLHTKIKGEFSEWRCCFQAKWIQPPPCVRENPDAKIGSLTLQTELQRSLIGLLPHTLSFKTAPFWNHSQKRGGRLQLKDSPVPPLREDAAKKFRNETSNGSHCSTAGVSLSSSSPNWL